MDFQKFEEVKILLFELWTFYNKQKNYKKKTLYKKKYKFGCSGFSGRSVLTLVCPGVTSFV